MIIFDAWLVESKDTELTQTDCRVSFVNVLDVQTLILSIFSVKICCYEKYSLGIFFTFLAIKHSCALADTEHLFIYIFKRII